jgi:D-3-phosphoglycerate dehydrogenase
MADTVVEALILDLLDWVARRERTYEEVMDAWRTSCPKLPVWEDANDRGFVKIDQGIVTITESGRAFLHDHLK